MDADVTSTTLPGRASQVLILCNNLGGSDLSVRVTEFRVASGPKASLGSISFDQRDLLQAAADGWVEITNEERAGVVCRPTEKGYEWLGHYRSRQLAKGRARL